MRRWGSRVIALVGGVLLASSGLTAANAVSVGDTHAYVGAFTSGLAVTPDGRYVYATVQSMGQVRVVDTTINWVIAGIPTGNWPRGVVLSPDGSRAYSTNAYDGTVSVIATATNSVIATVPLYMSSTAYPWGIAVSPDGTRLYISASTTNEFRVVDTSTFDVESITLPGYGGGVAVSPDGSRAYVMGTQPSPRFSVVDTASLSVTSVTFAGNSGLGITGVAVSPDGSRVYATLGGKLAILNAVDGSTIAEIAVSGIGDGLALSPDGSIVSVSRPNANTVELYDTATLALVDSVTLTGPGSQVFSPDGGKLYIVHGDAFSNANQITGFDMPAPPTLDCALPAATVGTAYSAGVVASGSPTPDVTLGTGSLPQGLELSIDGWITGTPTAAGTFTFTLLASNASGTDSCDAAITVAASGSGSGGGSGGSGGSGAGGGSVGGPGAGQASMPAALSKTGSADGAPGLLLTGALILGGGVLLGSRIRTKNN